jgi:hypothetical protein
MRTIVMDLVRIKLVLILILFTILFIHGGSDLYADGDKFANEGWDFRFSGYYKNLFIYQHVNNFQRDIYSPSESKKMISDLNRLRISPEINYSENFIFHTDAYFESVNSNYNKTDYFDTYWRESDYNEFVKLSREPYYSSKLYCRVEVQNMYGKMSSGKFTGTAGRQQVRFGSSRLWNPLDLMNPVSPLLAEGNREQKGTDSLRLDWYPGESTELTVVAAPRREDDDFSEVTAESGNYIARLQTGVKVFDAAILGGYTSKRKNGGADFAAEVYDGLFTGVFLYSLPSDGEGYYQCGSGYEYTFSSGIYFLMEYFYNSLPANDDEELQAALLNHSVYGLDQTNYYIISNRIITGNSHYLSIAAGYDFFPLLRGDLFSIYDFQGRGIFVNVLLKFNALENLDLSTGVITAYVDDTERNSDFKIYDEQPMYFVSLQFYF